VSTPLSGMGLRGCFAVCVVPVAVVSISILHFGPDGPGSVSLLGA
jgi:hypothetical protein